MNFSPGLTPFTEEGRKELYKRLKPYIETEISILMNSTLPDRTVEYLDNRISRFSMKMGKCEITGWELSANEVHCHHYVPKHLGGTDQFNNLRILHKDIHRLIHLKDMNEIVSEIHKLNLNNAMIKKLNQYRTTGGLKKVETFHF